MIKKLVNWFNGLKFRNKLHLLFVVVGLLPLSIVCVYMISGFHRMMIGREYESLTTSLNQACDTIENQVDIYVNLLNYSVFDSDLQEVLDVEQTRDYDSYSRYVNIVDPILNRPKFYHDGVNRMTIYADNIKVAHGTTLASLSEIQDAPWYEELQETDTSMWVWSVQDGKNHEELLVIRKFPGYRDTEAYLGLYCSVERLTESLNYYKKEGCGILLADDQNDVIYSQSDFEEGEQVQTIEEGESE